jgi:hypothetical protein
MQDGEIDRLKTQIEKGFKMEEGPFIKGLDQALKSFHVQREAYYGGTFIGNHVHKCCSEKTPTLCASLWSPWHRSAHHSSSQLEHLLTNSPPPFHSLLCAITSTAANSCLR